MKKYIAGALLLFAVPAMAYEIKDNPDRFLSVGVNYSGSFLKGTGTFEPVPGFYFNEEKDLKDNLNQGMVDVRAPVTENLTLSLGAGYVSRSVDRVDASLVPVYGGYAVIGDTLHDSLSGPAVSVGARYYFH